jgi:hypothetical protein
VSLFERRVACARAAAVLGRQQQDTEIVEEAAELVSGLFESDHVSLTLDQARDVLRKERAARRPPTKQRPGPEYGDLFGGRCQCAGCRRARAEGLDPFADLDDDDGDLDLDDDEDLGFGGPPDVPPDLARMLAEEVQKARRRGESVEEFLGRLFAGESRPKRSVKSRRR